MVMDRPLPEFTAKCRTLREAAGFRLTFFCEVCGSGYTTPVLACDTAKEALHLGEQEARLHFNRCEFCHGWVCDEHFNENRRMCTACMPCTCLRCGASVSRKEEYCPLCGAIRL